MVGQVLGLVDGDPRLRALLELVRERVADDPGHDVYHCLRVAALALEVAEEELSPRVVVAAALLHDIVNVPKDSPLRASASTLSAVEAERLLPEFGFDAAEIAVITRAIRDHSFSRGAVPEGALGRALQDADRLEALGALGVFRTISTGTLMGSHYFDPDDPWARARPLDDRRYAIDHFFTKLLRLPERLLTPKGRAEARRRAEFMRSFLSQLGRELGVEYQDDPGAAPNGSGAAP